MMEYRKVQFDYPQSIEKAEHCLQLVHIIIIIVFFQRETGRDAVPVKPNLTATLSSLSIRRTGVQNKRAAPHKLTDKDLFPVKLQL